MLPGAMGARTLACPAAGGGLQAGCGEGAVPALWLLVCGTLVLPWYESVSR